MSIRQQNREGWRVPLQDIGSRSSAPALFLWMGCRNRMAASGFSTSLAAPSARSFYGVFRLRQTLDGTVLCRHFHEQPPYSKRCTHAKRLSTTKGQRKEGLSAESTDMPSAHLAVQVADHEFRPAIIGHVFAGIGVDGFQILGKEAVEITVQLCHIHRIYCSS